VRTILGAVYYSCFILIFGFINIWIELQELQIIKSDKKSFRMFQRVRIFEKVLNDCVRGRIFQFVAFFLLFIQIFFGFIFIHMFRLASTNIINIVVLFLIYCVSLFYSILVFSTTAKIFTNSEKWIKNKNHGKKKHVRKLFRSVLPLRVNFCKNFVER
jgi:hypothetical protein